MNYKRFSNKDMAEKRVLVIFADEDDETSWNSTEKAIPKEGYSYQLTNFNKFTDGSRHIDFDIVLVYAPKSSSDDFEMQDELFKYYTVAPVVAVINDGPAEYFSTQFGNGTIVAKPGEDDETDFVAIDGVLEQAKAYYAKLVEEDVKPAFAKFDKDGSGAIDRNELGELMKTLGS